MRNKICYVILLIFLLPFALVSQQPNEMLQAQPEQKNLTAPQKALDFMGMPAAPDANVASPFGVGLQAVQALMPGVNQPEVSVTGLKDLNTPLQQTLQNQTSKEAFTNIKAETPIIATPKIDKPESNPEEQDESKKKDIFLNFENADLVNFVNYIADIRKLNLIVSKELESAKISITIRDPLTREGAWNVFLTVLEMSGFSIIQSGDVHKIIQKEKKLTEPLPSFINVSPDYLPDNDLTIRYVMFLTNIQIGDVQQLLESMLSQPNSVIPQKEVNGFVITDKSLNIKSAVKLLRDLDASGLPEEVTFLRLKRANAKDVQELLNTLIKKPEGNVFSRLLGKTSEGSTEYFSSGTRIIPEERTNSLILLGNPKSNKKIEDFVVNNIDTDLKEVESPLHIYELQNTEASQIVEILKTVTAAGDSASGASASKYGSIRGGVKYFRPMSFQVDKEGNRIIVSSLDKQDWKLLKKTIRDLDKPQPQVAIETLIVTVTADDNKKLGGDIRNKKHGQLGINLDAQAAPIAGSPTLEYWDDAKTKPKSLLGDMLNQLTFDQGMATITLGKLNNIWGAFYALKTQANASLLSQPFVTVGNKMEATVNVGSEKRVIQETTGSGNTAQTGWTSVKADTTLKITPQINLDGIIKMDINLNIEDFTSTDGTSKSIKNLNTKVTVADGQVLVLGGFIQTKVSEDKVKTPLLGDIPIIGWMFKNQSRVLTKQYIFIFMRPTIVKPREIPGIELYTKMKLHDATDFIEDNIETKNSKDPIHNWFFNPEKENYSHKVIDFANARYQPTTVDIKADPFYRSQTEKELALEENPENKNTEQSIVVKPSEPPAQKSEALPSTPIQGLDFPAESILEKSIEPVSLKSQQEITQPRAVEEMVNKLPAPVDNREKLKNLITSVPAVQSDGYQAAQPFMFMKPDEKAQDLSASPVNLPKPKIENPKPKTNLIGLMQEQAPTVTNKKMETPPAKNIQTKTVDKKTQLKNLLADVPSGDPFFKPQVGNLNKIPLVPEQTDRDLDKRSQLRNFISKEPYIDNGKQESLVVDPSKRNKLKDFLKESSSFAKNSHHMKNGKQRSLA